MKPDDVGPSCECRMEGCDNGGVPEPLVGDHSTVGRANSTIEEVADDGLGT